MVLGRLVFLPYLTGERTPHLDANLTGRGVGLHHGARRADLVRAVFEGVAFALRDGLDALREAGHQIDTALLVGGGSTASWWQRLLANALQISLTPHDAADASVRGAGLLAWQGLGHEIDPAAKVTRGTQVHPSNDHLEEALARFRSAGPAGG